MSEIVSKIKYAMSLRTPQEEALSYLDAISSHCDYKKDSKDVVEAAASEYCEKQRKVKAEFDFPSFCYAIRSHIILRTLLTVIPNDSSRSFWKKTRMLSVGLNRL